jgi:hypothetical protein
VLAGLGWLLGLAYSAGVLFWATNLLNRNAAPTGASPIHLAVPVMWSGAVFAVSVLVFVVAVGWTGGKFARLRAHHLKDWASKNDKASAHIRRRAGAVATFRALHTLDGKHALRIVGWLAATAAILTVLATAGVLSHSRPAEPGATGAWPVTHKAVTDVGGTLAGLLPLVIAALGFSVYRSETVRRAVGVVWDIATFWPRAAHPLAPPSYAERAIPQLQTRTTALLALPATDTRHVDEVLLSGHSQGAVICTATILQLPAWVDRIRFFSYGCQLTRLYGRVFPAYFGPSRLTVLADELAGPGQRPNRWVNFWRDTDPLGWPVDVCPRQEQVADPTAYGPSDGEVNDPPIDNHSGYPASAEYRTVRKELV